MKNFLKNLLHTIFPRVCLGCQKVLEIKMTDSLLCEKCLLTLTPISEFICSSCGRRQSEYALCHQNAIPLFPVFPYTDEPIKNVIYALKYQHIEKAGEILGILLWNAVHSSGILKNFPSGMSIGLIPIPLTNERKHGRGFNQSEIIGEIFAQYAKKVGYSFSWYPHALLKTHETPSQTTCPSHKKRRENIKKSFFQNEKINISEKFIFIIDDVSTSGATIEEAARVLKKAGVPHVAGLVIAKA